MEDLVTSLKIDSQVSLFCENLLSFHQKKNFLVECDFNDGR